MKKVLFSSLVLFVFLICQNVFPQTQTLPYNIYSPFWDDENVNYNEPSIATNPLDEGNVIVASNYLQVNEYYMYERSKIGVLYSTNFGQNWQQVVVPDLDLNADSHNPPTKYQKYADPSVDFNTMGTAYVAYLGVSPKTGPNGEDYSAILVKTSSNKGQDWSSTPIVMASGFDMDKPYIHIDKSQTSSGKNNLYVAYSKKANFMSNYNVYISCRFPSSNYIRSTVVASSPNKCSGAVVRTDKDGILYVFYYEGVDIGPGKIMCAISYDFGDTFSEPIVVSQNIYCVGKLCIPSYMVSDYSKRAYLGYDDGTNHCQFRTSSIPSVDIDMTNNTIYVVYANDQGEANNLSSDGEISDLYLAKSTNGGSSWTRSLIATGGNNFFPWVNSGPNGRLNIIYYYWKGAVGMTSEKSVITPVLLTSYNGGSSFNKTEISDYALDMRNSRLIKEKHFLGDYLGITSSQNYIWAAWTSDIDEFSSISPQVIQVGRFPLKIPVKLKTNLPTSVNVKVDNSPTYVAATNVGTTVNLTPFVNHTFEVVDEIVSEPEGYQKFRKWDVIALSDPYSKQINKIFEYSKSSDMGLVHMLAYPSTVNNYLEGVYSGTYNLKWHFDEGNTRNYTIPSQQTYYMFDNDISSDYYDITVAPSYTASNNINMNFLMWADGGDNLTRTEWFSSPRAITALYKGHMLSDNIKSLSTNGQRKIICSKSGTTGDGYYHMVYESMGVIFYTRSTDAGLSWSNEEALDYGTNPVIAYDNYGMIFVAYKHMDNDGVYRPAVRALQPGYYTWRVCENVPADIITTPSDDEDFAIAANGGSVVIIYRSPAISSSPSSLKAANLYYFSGTGPYKWSQTQTTIANTNALSNNPSVAFLTSVEPKGDEYCRYQFGLVYEQRTSTTENTDSEIKFTKIDCVRNNPDNIADPSSTTPVSVSSGSGYSINRYPSISAYGNNAAISWTGTKNSANIDKTQDEDVILQTKTVVVRNIVGGNLQAGFFSAGSNVSYSSTAYKQATGDGAVIAWNENDGASAKYVKRKNMAYDPMLALNPSGKMIQLATGPDFSYMKGMVINNASAPYAFSRISTDFNYNPPLQKEKSEEAVSYARTGVVKSGSMEFVFNIGDVLLNGNIVKFKNCIDTAGTINTVKMLETENFPLVSSSELNFSDYYYSLYTENAASLEDRSVNFTVELVSSSTNQIMGEYDRMTYSKENINDRASSNYSVVCRGIAAGNYFLRLRVEGDGELMMTDVQRSAEGMDKRSYKTMAFNGSELPKDYALEQNYPNPFNPSTVIRYQIPQAGRVTLKVYDILGREVASLVDGYKEQGRYEASFNASALSSGTYIYKIQVNEYSASRKMMLVK